MDNRAFVVTIPLADNCGDRELSNILRGRGAEDALTDEFTRRYASTWPMHEHATRGAAPFIIDAINSINTLSALRNSGFVPGMNVIAVVL